MEGLKRLARGDLRVDDRGPTAYLWSSLAHYGLRALIRGRMRRDTEAVHREYNRKGDRHEYWKPTLSPDEYIFDNGETVRWVLIDDQLVRGTLRQVRERVLPLLRERVEHYSKPGDLIVEFGAGTGRNLAYLARVLPDRRYLGIELTPNSVDDAREMLKACGVEVEMRIGDMTDPKLAEKPAVIYSVQALEQLPGEVSRAAIRQMAANARNAIVCIEPIRELYPRSVRGLTSRLRQYRADYLVGLPRYAKELGLDIVKLERTGLAENPLNEVCELLIEVHH